MAQRRTSRPDGKNHARTVCGFDPPHLFFPCRIDHADIVLAAHGQLATVRTEECLMRRTADIYLAFYRVRFSVDQRHGVGPYRNDIECFMVRRKAETVHRQFATKEWTQRRGNVFARWIEPGNFFAAGSITEIVFDVWSAVYTRSPAAVALIAPASENTIAKSFIRVTSPFEDCPRWLFRAIAAWHRSRTVDRSGSPEPTGESPGPLRKISSAFAISIAPS